MFRKRVMNLTGEDDDYADLLTRSAKVLKASTGQTPAFRLPPSDTDNVEDSTESTETDVCIVHIEDRVI